MPPRILIFVALSGDGPRAAAGAACEQAAAGSARPLSLDPASTPPEILRASDALAADLDLRPVARELATLSHVTGLLRERPNATVVIDAPRPRDVVALLSAADLARARLDAARPSAATTTLAARRLANAAGLTALRDAAAAGDLLRAPELTSVGLLAGPAADARSELTARVALTFAGVAVAPALLDEAPGIAAQTLADAGGTAALTRDPSPVARATAGGAELWLSLPDLPDDLRAVGSGNELALHAGGVTRRLHAPASMGVLVPSGVTASDDGEIVVRFAPRPEGHPAA